MFKKFRVYVLFSAAFALVGLLINRYRQDQPPSSEQVEILVPTEPEIVEAPTPPPTKAVKQPPKSQTPDDLTRISGIGPKFSAILQSAGVNTFEQLAALAPEDIRRILDEAGVRLGKPDTWPEQARQAAADQ